MEMRDVYASQYAQVNDLVSAAFQYPAQHFFFDDFPIWGSSLVTRLGVFDGPKLVSHVGIRFAEMQTGAGSEKIALIGAVATDEKYRGQGHSTALLKEALKRIDAAKYSWSFLWGSEHAFYGKLGFQLYGVQARARLSDLEVQSRNLISKSIQSGFTDEIFKALCNTKIGIRLKAEDRTWIAQQKTVKWYYLEKPFAFIAYEKGMDLKNIVHEMGGDLNGIQTLLYSIYSKNPDAEILGTQTELKKIGLSENNLIQEHLCLARALDSTKRWKEEYWVSGISAC